MADSFAQFIVIIGIPIVVVAIFALLIVLLVAIILHFRRGDPPNALRQLFSEILRLAEENYDPNMLKFYRLDMPPMHEYIRVVKSMIERGEKGAKQGNEEGDPGIQKELKIINSTLEDYNLRVGRNKKGIFLGNISGYLKINLLTSVEEMLHSKRDGDKYIIEIEDHRYEIPKKEIDEIEKVMESCGSFLNVIAYKIDAGWKIPGLWPRTKTRAMLCFDDQVMGLDSDDGIVTVLAPGVESHGFYFLTPSGYPDRLKVIVSFIQTLTWLRMLNLYGGDIFELVNNSLSINPGLSQLLAVKSMDKPRVKEVSKNE